MTPVRNDPAQYDTLADQWWDPRGALAMLGWIAKHRATLVPPSPYDGALLLDLACGGGLLAPHLAGRGYRHVGLDLSATAVRVAAEHGVQAVLGDVTRLPFADAIAQVVVAGELLEHVPDPAALVAEIARVLAPGGTLVLDTIARTRLARVVAITVAERVPGGPPRHLHDGDLFIDRAALVRSCAAHGIELRLAGLRPSLRDYPRWLAGRRPDVRMVPSRLTNVLFTGVGRKADVLNESVWGSDSRGSDSE